MKPYDDNYSFFQKIYSISNEPLFNFFGIIIIEEKLTKSKWSAKIYIDCTRAQKEQHWPPFSLIIFNIFTDDYYILVTYMYEQQE